MARGKGRGLPPGIGIPSADRMAIQQFAAKLAALMDERRWTNSDLARRIWGEMTDRKGHKVARNRDRIGVYLRAEGWPDDSTADKMAEVFGVPKSELIPQRTVAQVQLDQPELAMALVPGRTDQAYLQVNALVPLALASQIIQLIEQSRAGRSTTDGNEEDQRPSR